MKKFFTVLVISLMIILPVKASQDKLSEDYLKNHRHFSAANPIAESIAQKIIKKSLKKESGGKYRVKLDGYTLHSLKHGIFKYLEITGKNLCIENVNVPYVNIKTVSDYNAVDYKQNPPKFITDIDMYYQVKFTEQTINDALKHKEYQKIIRKLNNNFYPIISVNNVSVKIKKNKIYITIEYNFPINPAKHSKMVTISGGVYVSNGKIHTHNIGIDNPNGNLPLNRLISMVNIIDPLSFTVNLLEDKNCEGKIEKALIIDDIIQINGRILVKKD